MFLTKAEISKKFNDFLKNNQNQQIRTLFEKYKDDQPLLEATFSDLFEDITEELNPFKYDPVTPLQFIEDPYYCGKNDVTGIGVCETMYQSLKNDFCLVHDLKSDIRETILSGAIGWGKSFFMSLGLVWNLYILSCLKNPQQYFKLSPASKIAIMIISITEKQAKKNMYSNCKDMIKSIPYFKENFYFDDKRATESLVFDNNVELFSGTSSVSSTIGLNIYSAALDEANFFKVIQQSKRARESTGEFDEALTLYYSLLRRQESRFLKQGLKPGVLYLGSSNVYPDDFTAKRVKAAKESNSKSSYIMSYSQWSVDRNKFGKEEFKLELGGLTKKNRILEGYEEDVTGEVISIPMEFYDAFKKDIDNALRDMAGLALYSVQPFFGEKDKIQEMFDASLPKVFSVDLATLSPKHEYLITEKILRHEIFNKKQTRYIATDIGLKKDLLGFAMGHISEIKIMERQVYNDMTGEMDIIKEKLPVVVIDMLLSVRKEEEFGEVELQNVVKLVFSLKKFGYKIKYSSADGYQSAHISQIFKRNGINHDYISMDKTTEPYETFRSAVYDGRVKCPYNPKLEMELVGLEKDYVNNKVDHQKHSSKDLADAVGQLVYNCHVNMHFFDESLLGSSTVDQSDEIIESYEDILKNFNEWARKV